MEVGMKLTWDALIAPTDVAVFEREVFARKPLHLGARDIPASGLEELDGWRRLLAGQVSRSQGARTVVDLDPSKSAPSKGLSPELAALLDAGGPLIVNGVETMNQVVGQLARAVAAGLGGRAVVNAYISPYRRDALDLHADDHDVVVLQLQGVKSWTLGSKIARGLAHSSLFVIDNASVSALARERDSFRSLDIHPGDLLYLPRGLAHRATARDSLSIHLSIGVFRSTGLDFTEFVLKRLIGEARTRDYLGHPHAAHDDTEISADLDYIADRLSEFARDEKLRREFQELRRRAAGIEQGET
jgi:ribosomal protein L16 Arg81 hydroxylase